MPFSGDDTIQVKNIKEGRCHGSEICVAATQPAAASRDNLMHEQIIKTEMFETTERYKWIVQVDAPITYGYDHRSFERKYGLAFIHIYDILDDDKCIANRPPSKI